QAYFVAAFDACTQASEVVHGDKKRARTWAKSDGGRVLDERVAGEQRRLEASRNHERRKTLLRCRSERRLWLCVNRDSEHEAATSQDAQDCRSSGKHANTPLLHL